MTYTIKFTDDTKTTFTIPTYQFDGPGAPGGQHTSLMLVGKGYADYGEELWTNLVHMLENHSNSLPPQSPIEGQIWYDNSLSENLKIYKRGPGVQSRWVDIVDTELLRKLLYSSDFFPESILQYDVRIPAGVTNLHGNVHITGKLEVDGGIFSYKAPESMSEVVTLGFLNNKLSDITSKYVPLVSPPSGSTIKGALSIDGTFTALETIIIKNVPAADYEGANKLYVDQAIKNGGVGWPSKKPLTVLLTANGKDVEFSDLTPEYICKYSGTISSDRTQFMVIAGDTTTDRAYWKNLDTDYVYVGDNNSSDQDIIGAKTFNKLTLNGEVNDADGPGAAGEVLTSQGVGLPPIWSSVSGGGGSTPSPGFTGLFDNGTNETVTVTSGTRSITYQRGYMRLPNNLIAQWIIGYPLSDDSAIYAGFKTTNTYTFTENQDDLKFLYSSLLVDDNILSRYSWKYPFSNINFKSVTSQLSDNIGVFSPSKNNYKWSEFGSSKTNACVSFQQFDTRHWYEGTSNPPFIKVAPLIFALGTEDITSPYVPEKPSRLVFSTNGDTWTIPSNATAVRFTLIGGGSGGTKGVNDNDWENGGGGGGSGGIKIYDALPADIGTEVKFYIGSGGASDYPGTQTSINVKTLATGANFNKPLAVAGGGLKGKGIKGGLGGIPGGNNGTNGAQDKSSDSTVGVRSGMGGASPLALGSGGLSGSGSILQPDIAGVMVYGVGGPGLYWGAGGGGGRNGKLGGAGMKGVVIADITY
jgi:hypothetical protein